MTETPAAQQAFEDYWGLGDGRSLSALAALYRQRSDSGEEVPTTRERTLGEWSTQHGWQDRLKQRIAEEAERTREEMRKRAAKFREAVATGIEADVRRYLQRLQAEGGNVLAESAADLERMVKLYYALCEQPLAERHEHTGAGGGAVQVQHGFDPDGIAEALRGLLGRRGGVAGGGTGELDADTADD